MVRERRTAERRSEPRADGDEGIRVVQPDRRDEAYRLTRASVERDVRDERSGADDERCIRQAMQRLRLPLVTENVPLVLGEPGANVVIRERCLERHEELVGALVVGDEERELLGGELILLRDDLARHALGCECDEQFDELPLRDAVQPVVAEPDEHATICGEQGLPHLEQGLRASMSGLFIPAPEDRTLAIQDFDDEPHHLLTLPAAAGQRKVLNQQLVQPREEQCEPDHGVAPMHVPQDLFAMCRFFGTRSLEDAFGGGTHVHVFRERFSSELFLCHLVFSSL